ncbi:MAG: proprotein convertase P-domain-containing protein, partial [Planctomycetota bacterium]
MLYYRLPLLLSLILTSNILPAQPINDDCSGASNAVLGINSFDITAATDSAIPADDSVCTDQLLGQLHRDVWWRFVPASSGLLTVSTCNTANFDSDIAVYNGSCTDLQLIGCNGDATGCALFTSQVLEIPVAAGSDLLIRVGGWNTTSIGSGDLVIDLQGSIPPLNLQCAAVGTELTASWDAPLPVDGWEILLDGVLIEVLDSSATSWSGGQTPGIGEQIDLCVAAVFGAESAEACCTIFGGPINDNCGGALDITGESLDFDTTTATDGNEPFDPSPCAASLPGDLVQDLWYRWTSPGNGSVQVSTCSNANFDTTLAVYDGDCGGLIPLACNGDFSGCSNFTSLVSDILVTTGQQLFIRIGGWQFGDAGSGTLEVQFSPALVENFSTNSLPGSGNLDISWQSVSDLTSTTLLIDGVTYSTTGSIAAGTLHQEQISGFLWPASIEVCLLANSAAGSATPICQQIDVIASPIEIVSGSIGSLNDNDVTIATALVSGTELASDLRVEVEIDHPRISDLQIRLLSAEGEQVLLHNGDSASGLHAIYWQPAPPAQAPYNIGASMRPVGPGSLIDVCTSIPAGEWILEIEDQVAGESGTLIGWSLHFFDVAPAYLPAPDLIAGEHSQMSQLGREGDEVGLMLQSVCCNHGDEPLDWHGNPDPRHPFMVFNLYRVSDDRIVQVGSSWAKHAPGPATTADACGFGCTIPTDPYTLGIGCSDIYSAGFNGTQTVLGPRSEIDPWTGNYDYNSSILNGPLGSVTPVDRRLRIHDLDLDPNNNPNSDLFVEALYIAADDPNPDDNMIHEPVDITSGSPGDSWGFSLSEPSQIGPAIHAWPGASISKITPDDGSDGEAFIAAKAFPLDAKETTWRYEYAIWNHNLSRHVGQLEIPLSPGVEITDIYFRAPQIESVGYADLPWQINIDPDAIQWSAPVENPLRWGYLYNFGFSSNTAPTDGTLLITGQNVPTVMSTNSVLPGTPPLPLMRRGDGNADGQIDIADAIAVLSLLFLGSGDP